MFRALGSRAAQRASRLAPNPRSPVCSTAPAVQQAECRTAAYAAQDIWESRGWSTTGSSYREQEQSGQSSRGHLLPWAAAAILYGEASCARDDGADHDEEVLFVRPEYVPLT